MLPFLKNPAKQSGLVVEMRKPDSQEPNESEGLHMAAEDLIKALDSKDIKSVAAALRAAFLILDSMPHEEAPHSEE